MAGLHCYIFDFSHVMTSQAGYKKALMFVDNAGSDVCLGMVPLARELLKLGCKVLFVVFLISDAAVCM